MEIQPALSPEEAERAGRFRKIREHFGKSQVEFSHELGLGDITWQNYERGKSRPTSTTLNAINQRLNVNLNWLSFGRGGMFNESDTSGIVADKQTAGIGQANGVDEDKLFRLVLCGLREIYAGVDGARLPEADYVAIRANKLARRICEMTESDLGAHRAAVEFLDMEQRIAETMK
jgi:transcriptional regulator with XRE-family HTH domain